MEKLNIPTTNNNVVIYTDNPDILPQTHPYTVKCNEGQQNICDFFSECNSQSLGGIQIFLPRAYNFTYANSLAQIIQAFTLPIISLVYTDLLVKDDDDEHIVYFPSFIPYIANLRTIINTPIVSKQGVQLVFNNKAQYLYSHHCLCLASQKYICKHIPKPLFTQSADVNVDFTADIKLLRLYGSVN